VREAVINNTQSDRYVTGLENGSFSYVVMNQVKVVAVGSQKLLPATDVLPV